MNHLLRGFADELMKVAGLSPPSMTAPSTPSSLKPPRPAGAAESSGVAKPMSIPTQKMESPMGQAPATRFRPAASFSPNKASDPEPVKPKNTGGGGKSGGPKKDFVPWQTASQNVGRAVGERLHTNQMASQAMKATQETAARDLRRADAPGFAKWQKYESNRSKPGPSAPMPGLAPATLARYQTRASENANTMASQSEASARRADQAALAIKKQKLMNEKTLQTGAAHGRLL